MLLRLLFSLLRIERAGQRHKAVQHDLKSTYAAQRAKADCSSQDFFLQRDLERSQEEDKRKPKR